MKLPTEIAQLYQELDIKNKRVAVMYSGGPDSVYMLETLMATQVEHLEVWFIDYVNTPAAPNRAANFDFVLDARRKKAFNLNVHTVDISRYYEKHKGPEGNCHLAKSDLINTLAKRSDIDYIFVGHNLDDHIETVLIQLFRGAGKGTRGLRDRVRGKVVKPLLSERKSDIEQYCKDLGLDYFTDSQNMDITCTRAFMRHKLIPLLEEHYGNGTYKRIANIGKKFETL